MAIAGGNIIAWAGWGGLAIATSGVGDFPDPSNVLNDDTTNGVPGTYVAANPAYYKYGEQYGAGGTEFTGSLIVPIAENAGDYLGPGGAMRKLFVDDTTGVYSIVGYKIYPSAASQKADPPYGVYRTVDTTHEEHLSNMSGIARARIQWDWFARDPEVVASIMQATKLAAARITNRVITIGSTSINIKSIKLEMDYEDFEPVQDASGKPIFRGIQDFYVWFNEEIPTR